METFAERYLAPGKFVALYFQGTKTDTEKFSHFDFL